MRLPPVLLLCGAAAWPLVHWLAGCSLIAPPLRDGLFDTLRFAALAAAAWASHRRSRRCPETQQGAWRMLALGLGLQALAYLLGFPNQFLHAQLSTASRQRLSLVCDALDAAARAPLLFSLLRWPLRSREGVARRVQAMDALLAITAVLFILLVGFPKALVRLFDVATGGYFAVNLCFLAFFLFSVATGTLSLLVGVESDRAHRRGLYALGGPLLLFSIATIAQLVLFFGGRLFTPTDWTNQLELAAFWLALCGALWEPEGGEAESGAPLLPPGILPGLAYLPVAAALGLGAWAGLARPETLSLAARMAGTLLLGLVALHHYQALHRVKTMNQGLEAVVAHRTRALEESLGAQLRTQRMNMVATLGAGLAHDMRNLLTVISSGAGMAIVRAENGDPADIHGLQSIEDAAVEASDMVQHLMLLGRETGGQRARFDLGDQVRACHPLLQRLAGKSIHVSFEPDPVPLPVEADKLQIEQILVNLVSNARDAMPEGGLIRIRTALTQENSHSRVLLEVEDSGPGMPPEIVGKVFDPFFTTKEPGKGTGLGLASVKAIVDSWSGELNVESAPGRGSVFSIRLARAS